MAKGTVTELPNGRFWVRAPLTNGQRPSLGVFTDRDEADAVAASATDALDTGALSPVARPGIRTFATWGSEVLKLREADGVRGIKAERSVFGLHLEHAPFAGKALDKIRPVDVATFARQLTVTKAKDRRGVRNLSRHTVARALALGSAIMAEAVTQGLLEHNPFRGVRVKVKGTKESTKEKWAFLDPSEQATFFGCESIPWHDRMLAAFAWGTGLRQGEQWNLELRDLHVDGPNPHVFVRYGSRGLPPKSGKTRAVPLFGIALDVARAWLAALPAFLGRHANEHRLVFPTPRGARRQVGKLGRSDTFARHVATAGLTKHLRWHDLRLRNAPGR